MVHAAAAQAIVPGVGSPFEGTSTVPLSSGGAASAPASLASAPPAAASSLGRAPPEAPPALASENDPAPPVAFRPPDELPPVALEASPLTMPPSERAPPAPACSSNSDESSLPPQAANVAAKQSAISRILGLSS
jgi:hypothetical protein